MEQNDYDFDIITVTDDDGKEYQFEEIDRIETDDAKYVALLPVLESAEDILADDGDVIVLKVTENEDGETYLSEIEDEDEFNEISDIFQDRLDTYFDFDEDD